MQVVFRVSFFVGNPVLVYLYYFVKKTYSITHHCDLKPKANNKCFVVLKCTCKVLQKSIIVSKNGKIKAQGVATPQSRPCLIN